MSFYQHLDYRRVLKDLLEEQKMTQSQFADVIGVQKTFVSKVLSEQLHLSDDQLFLALQYLDLSPEKQGYFQLLYTYSRTGLAARKKMLLKEIKALQENYRSSRSHIQAEIQNPEISGQLNDYYLDPMNLIVHAHLGLPKYRKQPELLLKVLDLNSSQLKQILELLERLKVIAKSTGSGEISVLKNRLHLDNQSYYLKPHQTLFRMKNTEHVMKLSPEERFLFNVTFSADRNAQKKIQEKFLSLAKELEKIVQEAESEEVFQLSFDLFPWTKPS